MTEAPRVDTLTRDDPAPDGTARDAPPGFAALLLALFAFLLLDQLFGFANRVTTFGVVPQARLSIELLVAVGCLALWKRRGGSLPRWALGLGGASIAGAALLRYIDVTAPGVLGRRFDLNADLSHVGNVASMFAEELSPLQQFGIATGLIALLSLLVLVCAAALRSIERGLDSPGLRVISILAAVMGLALFLGERALGSRGTPMEPATADRVETEEWDPWVGRMEADASNSEVGLFAEPVTGMIARQIGTVLRGSGELRLRSVVPSNLRGLEDAQGVPAHVVMVFLESYGVTLIDDPQHFPYIEATFRRVEQNLSQHGFAMRSVRAISPTFGGGSWRAHATVMSGIRIDNEQLYDRLLESEWRGLPHLLAEKGYRTLAAEPGIREEWPEGEGLRLDKIYDSWALDYRGEPIGWWIIPDQYTLYKIGKEELQGAEAPVFAKISLILSHIPYLPIPPVVQDWSRFDDGTAYSRSLPSVGADDYRDLDELSSRYVAAFRYELEILERWLIDQLPDNSLVVISGDHQPPMLSTHSNDSWDVPFHVISRRPELVDAFAQRGFAPGLLPPPEARLPMEAFLPTFLEIFDR